MFSSDWAPRTVIVKNSGKDDLFYQADIINEGPDKLFNELQLEVANGKHTLYEGKLADFSGLHRRNVEPSEQEELEFTVRFPEHLGNDYQGLRTTFTLTFTVNENGPASNISHDTFFGLDGTINSGDAGDDGETLPSTATNIFNFFFSGGILVIVGGALFVLGTRKKKE